MKLFRLSAVTILVSLISCCLATDMLNLPDRTRILFQGDSITDMNRGRTSDPNHILGHSYAFLIAARTGASKPELGLEFFNRGISGNKVSDLLARWQSDTIDLHPDVLSILIGINDVGSGVSTLEYETQYDKLLTATIAALPKVRLVICEPFALAIHEAKDKWAAIDPRVTAAQEVCRRLAKKHHAVFVPLQKVFNVACSKAPASYWIWDGIHPTYAGQQLVADQWVRVVNKQIGRSQ